MNVSERLGGSYDIAKSIECKESLKLKSVSKKFLRMTKLYEIFASDWKNLYDFSEEAKIELYNVETFGGKVSDTNGYALGKKWLNVNVSMWKDDIETGILFKSELYLDDKFPHWWLDSIFKRK